MRSDVRVMQLYPSLPLAQTYGFVGSAPAAPSHKLSSPECVSGSTTLHLTKFNASCNANASSAVPGLSPGARALRQIR